MGVLLETREEAIERLGIGLARIPSCRLAIAQIEFVGIEVGVTGARQRILLARQLTDQSRLLRQRAESVHGDQ